MVCFRAFGKAAQDAILADAVADQDEPPASHVHRTEQGGKTPVERRRDAGGVAHHLVIVDVINHDVVRTLPPVLDAARRLTPSERHEKHPVFGLELADAPTTLINLDTEVRPEQGVVLQLALKVRQEPVGTVFRFADQHHDMYRPRFLYHEPNRNQEADMGTLGMATSPLEYGTGMAVRLQILRRIQLELPATCYFSRLLIGAKVRKVGFYKVLIVFPSPFDAGFPCFAGIGQAEVRRQDELLALFPLFPSLFGDTSFSHC